MAYDRYEPIGDRRFDLLFAQLSWVMYNVARMLGSKAPAKELSDFIPQWSAAQEESEEASREKLAEKLASAFTLFGGKDTGGS